MTISRFKWYIFIIGFVSTISAVLALISWTTHDHKRQVKPPESPDKYSIATKIFNKQKEQKHVESSAFVSLGFSNIYLMEILPNLKSPFEFSLLPEVNFLKSHDQKRDYRWSMVVMVKSHIERSKERDKIRRTWGSLKYSEGVQLETIFVVGKKHPSAELNLLHESKLYKDILQVELPEAYESIGLKVLSGMQWVRQNIPEHWMHVSADDDMVPHHSKLYRAIDDMIKDEFQRKNFTAHKNISLYDDKFLKTLPIHCGFSCRPNAGPIRHNDSKWFVDNRTYPLDIYPSLCLGGWYSMPVFLAGEILYTSRRHRYFHLDDVWITGLLRLSYFSQPWIDCVSCRRSDPNLGMWVKRVHQGELVRHTGKG